MGISYDPFGYEAAQQAQYEADMAYEEARYREGEYEAYLEDERNRAEAEAEEAAQENMEESQAHPPTSQAKNA